MISTLPGVTIRNPSENNFIYLSGHLDMLFIKSRFFVIKYLKEDEQNKKDIKINCQALYSYNIQLNDTFATR